MSRRLLSIAIIGALCGGVLVGGVSVAALAAPSYPSWDDVAAARSDSAATAAEVQRIQALIGSLSTSSDEASQKALEAGEQAQVFALALQDAEAQAASLRDQLATARGKAAAAKKNLGSTIASLARAGSDGVSRSLLAAHGQADDVLYRLGALEKVTGSQKITVDRARQAMGDVSSLTAQSEVVEEKRAAAAAQSQAAATAAQHAADAAEAAVTEQQEHGAELQAQLELLQDKTATVEAKFAEGQRARAEAAAQASAARAAAAAQAAADRAAAAARPRPGNPGHVQPSRPAPSTPHHNGGGNGGNGGNTGGGNTGGGNTGGGGNAPAGAASSAVRFALAQVGKWYVFGGEGPNTWDCSGLTMIAYRQGGVNIGAHTVGAQYRYLNARGLLASASGGLRPGDLLFYNQGSSTYSQSMYHITMYIGNGQMVEAPQPGQRVKVGPVRTRNLVPFVGRPA